MATGMESMVNNLVKSLSGMTIDQIKAQAVEAQKHFLAFIKNVNDNFTIIDYRIRQLTDAHTEQAKHANDYFRLITITLEQLMAEQQAARKSLDNMRADLAPILRANGIDISDDLIEVLKKRAGEGMQNGGIPHLVLIPAKLEHVPSDPWINGMTVDEAKHVMELVRAFGDSGASPEQVEKAVEVLKTAGLGGRELLSDPQSKPEDSQDGKKVNDVNTRSTD